MRREHNNEESSASENLRNEKNFCHIGLTKFTSSEFVKPCPNSNEHQPEEEDCPEVGVVVDEPVVEVMEYAQQVTKVTTIGHF